MDDLALEISPHNLVPGTAAYVLVAVLHLATPFVMLVFCYVRAHRANAQARAADDVGKDAKPLAAGPACVRGRVEYAHGHEHALRVEIDQNGLDHKGKGNTWSHSWRENGRRVTATSFFVNDPRGRVRVEPDERTFLVDKLDRTVRHSTARRTRIAEIVKDEEVCVVGQLEGVVGTGGAYREGERALVMRNPPNGRLLVSTEPLGNRFRAVMRMQRGFGIFFTIFFLVFLTVDMPFYLRAFFGRVEKATITELRPYTGKNKWCAVYVALPSEKVVELSADYYECGRLKTGSIVNVTVVTVVDRFAIAGSKPAIHHGAFVVAGFALVVGLLGYRLRARPWYEGKFDERGPGKLMESKD